MVFLSNGSVPHALATESKVDWSLISTIIPVSLMTSHQLFHIYFSVPFKGLASLLPKRHQMT